VVGQGFDTPTEDNLARLFEIMRAHARRYLALYYPHAAPGRSETLRDDAALVAWLDELNATIPGGVGLDRDTLDVDGLARLLARCLYLVTVQHELVGSFLWNYQNWVYRQPVRVYANGQREPMDVYQRLVNANFNLNVHRRGLMDRFDHLALDDLGAAEMQRFVRDLQTLQDDMAREPWAAWKLYPLTLKVNINA
jgi:arachidonate 15-lipoxygenase